jgi:DNA polymerase (family 10)
MDYEYALPVANKVKDILAPYCSRIEIAGSIRRRRPFTHDIDLVVIPANQGQFITALRALGPFKVGGQKLIRVNYRPLALDIYVATPETWATLLLIRTGSAAHNIWMCELAKSKGMKLHADGSGLFRILSSCDRGMAEHAPHWELRVAGDTEESIFEALGIKYKKPEEREIR